MTTEYGTCKPVTGLLENRIEGVLNINRVWLIPKEAKKPDDARRRKE